MFRDRKEAAEKLAATLIEYANADETILVALPRGGVVVGYAVARALNLPLDIVSPRKIGAPNNEEFAIGAITETGEGILSLDLIKELGISEAYLKATMEIERQKAKWRLDHYRQSRPPRNLKGKRVILVDDGIATGSTMRAAIKTVRAEQASEIVVAIPISPPDTLARLEKEVDKIYCLATPPSFYAVGQFYDFFDQVDDAEVIRLLAATSPDTKNKRTESK